MLFFFYPSASTSIEDFAIRVGLNPDIVQFFQKDLEIYTSDNYPFEKTMRQARSEVILARALEKFGLLDLNLRQRSRSKSRKPKGYYYPKYSSSATESDRNNRYNNGNNYYGGDLNYQGYGTGYDRDRNYYNNNDYDSYYSPKNRNKNRFYNSNRNNDYYHRKQDPNQRNPYYSGTANNNDYYNRNYDSSNYNRYIPHAGNKPRQQGYYHKGKPSSSNRNPQYAEYEGDKSAKNKLTQAADDDKIYNNYDSTRGNKISDETTNDINSNLPKYIAYKWNTKPKDKSSKSRYIYYG